MAMEIQKATALGETPETRRAECTAIPRPTARIYQFPAVQAIRMGEPVRQTGLGFARGLRSALIAELVVGLSVYGIWHLLH